MSTTLTLVDKTPVPAPEVNRTWRERPVSDRWIFRAQDEAGRRGWFFRLDITGLYPRRVGPFPTRAEARDCFEDLLAEIILEPLLTLQNELAGGPPGRCVVEGVPTLTGRKTGR